MVTPRLRAPRGGSFGFLRRAAHPQRRIARLLCAIGLGIIALPLRAQNVPPVVTVEGTLTASDNGSLGASGRERNELITSVRPRVVFGRRGAGLEFDVDAAATLLHYANGTQGGGIRPDARAALKATLVERLFYIDALAHVRQAEVDQFGARADDGTGANRRTQGTYRISPTIERELTANTSLLARHDATLTTNGAGPGERLLSNRTLVRLEREPVPVGGAVELSRLENESRGSSESRFTLDTARLRGSVRLGEQIVLEGIVGRDRSEFLFSEETDSLYGVGVQWRPGPRTELLANVEHRFFGNGGGLTLRHRMPFMSVALSVSRQPITASSSLGVVGQGADVRSALDAILTTRYPDPAVRSGLVDALVTSRGLDTRAPNAIDVVAQYPQLQTAANLTWVLLGRRNTASLALYTQTVRQLTRDGDPLSAAVAAAFDSRQKGARFEFNRRLTPQMSADAMLRWSRITGLAERAGDESDEKIYRLALTRNVSPRTAVSGGAQVNRFTTSASGQRSYDATLVFVGMSHRF